MGGEKKVPRLSWSGVVQRDWVIFGILWAAIVILALGPFGILASAARSLLALVVVVHAAEALYVVFRLRDAPQCATTWLLATLVMGLRAVVALEKALKTDPA